MLCNGVPYGCITAEPLASLLPVRTNKQRIVLSRPLEITAKMLDLCLNDNSVYVSIWATAFIGFELRCIHFWKKIFIL